MSEACTPIEPRTHRPVKTRLSLRAAAAASASSRHCKRPAPITSIPIGAGCCLPVDLKSRTGALYMLAIIRVVAVQEAARDAGLAVIEHDARMVVEPPVDAQLPCVAGRMSCRTRSSLRCPSGS